MILTDFERRDTFICDAGPDLDMIPIVRLLRYNGIDVAGACQGGVKPDHFFAEPTVTFAGRHEAQDKVGFTAVAIALRFGMPILCLRENGILYRENC